MKNKDVLVIVSKVCSRNGDCSFSIKTNLPNSFEHSVQLPKTGIIPEIGSIEYNELERSLRQTMGVIFSLIKKNLEVNSRCLSYKLIFSDRHIATGIIPLIGSTERIESFAEISLPLSTNESVLIFRSIPSTC